MDLEVSKLTLTDLTSNKQDLWAWSQCSCMYSVDRTDLKWTVLWTRVRTILVLGYWVLGNIHRYWVVSLLGDIFCCSNTQSNTNQTAVSTVHVPVNDYLVPLVTCTLTDAIICLDTMLICYCLLSTIIAIIIEFWGFTWYSVVYILLQINTLLCYTI